MGPSISEYVKRCAVQKCTGIQQFTESVLYDDVQVRVIQVHTRKNIFIVFKNNEDIFLQHYFWYTLLLIETRSLAVHDDFLTFDNCAQPNTQS